jgi:hypothetical protein
MIESEIQNNSARVAAKYKAYVEQNRERAHARLFLCGKALAKVPIEDQIGTHIRAYLWHRLEREVEGCQVFMGEHKRLIEQYNVAMGKPAPAADDLSKTNLSRFELSLARWVHLVVILPESAGSLAELGMFSIADKLGSKLVLLMNAEYQADESFINHGPVRAAKKIGARVHYVDYEYQSWPAIYDLVRQEVEDVLESLATQGVFSREDE